MSKKFTAFEEKLNSTLENYELPFENGDWKRLENQLDKGVASNHWVVALAAAAFFTGAIGLGVFTYSNKMFEATGAAKLARFENQIDVKNAKSQQSTNDSSIAPDANVVANSNNSSSNKPVLAPTEINGNSSINENASANTAAEKPNTIPTSTALSVRPSTTSSCAGGEVEFNAVNGPIDGSYLWNFGDGNFSNKPNPKHKYAKAGVYDVSLSVTSKKDGQINTTVMNDLITIHPAPSADFEWDFVNNPGDEPTVKIVNTSENASSFEWKFNDGTTSKVISPVRSYNDKGKQMIALEVRNEWGCSDSKIKYVVINQEYNLMAPNSFNPTAKETFMPEALKQGKTQFKLTVYNGEQPIYETNNKAKGWDGRLPGGQLAESGKAYPWIVIIYNETTKEEKYFSGTVTVLP
ncbi:MAG: PKD domain-containing protein [Flavobacteriales bacterium]|jgi:PKD repeat protein